RHVRGDALTSSKIPRWVGRSEGTAKSTCARTSLLPATFETTCGSSTMSSDSQSQLVLVSNRGPVTFQEDGSVKRGTGGLVTALTGLASHRDAIWIASAMTPEDVRVAREHDGKPFEVEAPEGGSFRVRFVDSEDEAYDRFYNIIANPMLWFIQHYLWDLSNAPDIRRHEVEAFEDGYQAVNRDLAEAVIDEIEGQDE